MKGRQNSLHIRAWCLWKGAKTVCIYVPDVYLRAPKQFASTCLMFMKGRQNNLCCSGQWYIDPKVYNVRWICWQNIMKFIFPHDFERIKYSKRVATGRDPSLTLKKRVATGRKRSQNRFFLKKNGSRPVANGRDRSQTVATRRRRSRHVSYGMTSHLRRFNPTIRIF